MARRRVLVGHAREEEYLELSDALQKRDYDATMEVYWPSARAGRSAPLQLLGAMTSIVRTLLMSFERMRAALGRQAAAQLQRLPGASFPQIEAEAKAAKTRVPHPYAAFMGMQAAAQYGRKVLLEGLTSCAESRPRAQARRNRARARAARLDSVWPARQRGSPA